MKYLVLVLLTFSQLSFGNNCLERADEDLAFELKDQVREANYINEYNNYSKAKKKYGYKRDPGKLKNLKMFTGIREVWSCISDSTKEEKCLTILNYKKGQKGKKERPFAVYQGLSLDSIKYKKGTIKISSRSSAIMTFIKSIKLNQSSGEMTYSTGTKYPNSYGFSFAPDERFNCSKLL